MAATNSTAEAPTPRRGPFSFSLWGLLLTTTCLAVALAITNWSLWDNDERWILRVWFAGAITLALLDRMRGKRGILAAAFGGGIAPALMTLQMWQNPLRFAIDSKSWIVELGHNSVLLVFFAGALTAGLLAAACWFLPRRPARTAAVLATLAVVSIGAWWILDGPRWQPRLVIDRTAWGDGATSLDPGLALSADGRLLAIASRPRLGGVGARLSAGQRKLELWSLGGAPERLGVAPIGHEIGLFEFSPDARQLVVAPDNRLFSTSLDYQSFPPVLWFDVPTALRTPPRQSKYTWLLTDLGYSADGATLTAIGMRRNNAGQRLMTIDAKTGAVIEEQLLAEDVMTAVHPLAMTVVQREIISRWDPADESSTLWSPGPFNRLIVSRDNRWLVSRDYLVDLQTRRVRRVEGHILASAGGGKWILAIKTSEGPQTWIVRLPILRHRYFDPPDKVQLVLINPASGDIVRASPWYEAVRSVAVSRDGSAIASCAGDGQIQIWDVPR